MEQCHAKNLPLEGQPVGAGGEMLGTVAIVLLKVQVTETDILREVPCYVLDSSKPLWTREVSDSDIMLGTNALGSLEFNITHPNGAMVTPAKVAELPATCLKQGKELLTLSTGPTSATSQQQPPESSTEGQTKEFNVKLS